MKSFYFILAGACLSVIPLQGSADLGPIVITPTRTEQVENRSSATVYVISAEDIEASGATTTAELLRGIPGVQIDDLFGNGTNVNISVRGFSCASRASGDNKSGSRDGIRHSGNSLTRPSDSHDPIGPLSPVPYPLFSHPSERSTAACQRLRSAAARSAANDGSKRRSTSVFCRISSRLCQAPVDSPAR